MSGLFGGLIGALVISTILLLGLRFTAGLQSADLPAGLLGGLIAGSGIGLVTGMVMGWLGSRWHIRLEASEKPKYAIITTGLFAGLLGTAGIWNVSQLVFGPISGLALSLISGLQLGIVVSVMLRSGRIQPVEHLRWSWSSIRKVLLMAIGMGFVSTLLLQMAFASLAYSLFIGLVFGLGFLLFFMLFSGLGSGEVPIKTRPNEGIRRSFFNAIITWLVGAVIGGLGIGCIVGLMGGMGIGIAGRFMPGSVPSLGSGMIAGINLGLLFGMFFGPLFGPLFGLSFGGLAVIQHSALRFVLINRGYVPWHYPRFLDYCAERILLRKVGGGYIFIHRMLLEYFASLETEQKHAEH